MTNTQIGNQLIKYMVFRAIVREAIRKENEAYNVIKSEGAICVKVVEEVRMRYPENRKWI